MGTLGRAWSPEGGSIDDRDGAGGGTIDDRLLLLQGTRGVRRTLTSGRCVAEYAEAAVPVRPSTTKSCAPLVITSYENPGASMVARMVAASMMGTTLEEGKPSAIACSYSRARTVSCARRQAVTAAA